MWFQDLKHNKTGTGQKRLLGLLSKVLVFVCQPRRPLKKKQLTSCTPKYLGKKSKPSIQANYVLRAMDQFPNKTYKFYQNYLVEYISFKWTKINDGAVDFK